MDHIQGLREQVLELCCGIENHIPSLPNVRGQRRRILIKGRGRDTLSIQCFLDLGHRELDGG